MKSVGVAVLFLFSVVSAVGAIQAQAADRPNLAIQTAKAVPPGAKALIEREELKARQEVQTRTALQQLDATLMDRMVQFRAALARQR